MTPNPWALYGLSSNPFFQETLSEDSSHFPLQLFVGRTSESQRLLQQIGGGISSRSVIAGPPGIGKTTLAQYVKGQARTEGYVASDDSVSVTSEEGTGAFLLRIVSHIYDAALRRHPDAADSEPLSTARNLLRTFRLQGYQGGVQVLGSGIQGGAQPQVVRSVGASQLSEVWRLGQEIVQEITANHGASGVILHVNNFENLAGGQDLQGAAQVLRDLRDFFLTPHLHSVFVGTENVLVPVLTQHQQVRSIIPFPEPISPLEAAEVDHLLERRYSHLHLSDRPFVRPVESSAVRRVYGLYRGDLRGALRALEEATLALAGLGEGDAVEPLPFTLIAQLLEPRYRTRLQDAVSEALFQKFQTLEEFGDDSVTQAQMSDLWDVTPQRVGQLLPDLERLGFLQSVGRDGRTVLYALSGTGRLALGLV